MRNLYLLRNVIVQKSVLSDLSKCFILNEPAASEATRVFAFTKCLKVHVLSIKNKSDEGLLIADLSKYVNTSDNVTVVGCNYMFGELFIILNTGYLITLAIENETNDVQTKQLDTTSIVQVSWSPDSERAVIVSENGALSVVSVNDDYDCLQEISLVGCVEEHNKFVNVGWGSVETQFRGTEGKLSKVEPAEVSHKEDSSDTSIHICWKQNSCAFAVSYVCPQEKIRKVKVFNQDGLLLNVTKNIKGLYPVIDWWPSRNLITTVQKLPNKKVICFMEENALRHGDFQISDDITITELRWNNNGSILACRGTENENQFIALWTTSNYKWYQKQKLEFGQRITCMQWDLAASNRLHVILESGVYRMYEWCFQITESNECECNKNLSIIAVINDKTISLTPYKLMCRPPSIPYFSFTVPSAVNAIIYPCFSTGSEMLNSNSALMYLSNNRCLLTRYENCCEEEYCFNFGDVGTEIEFSTPLEMSAWLWVQPYSLYFEWSRCDGGYFCVADLEPVSKSVVIKKMMKLDSHILAVASHKEDVIVHTEDGFLFVYQKGDLRRMNMVLLEPCFRLQVLNNYTLLGLSEHRNLYINDNIKWRDVVSFYWRSPFLVVLTMYNQLLISKVDFVGMEAQFNEITARSVEPKSYLVSVADNHVLLEMERGNLEVVTPRPFSICKMEELSILGRHPEVIKLVRRQRINHNVLIDSNPFEYKKTVKNIVNITNPMYLTTFITELENGNIAQKLYPWKYDEEWLMKLDSWENGFDWKNKVKIVCEEIMENIDNLDHPQLIGPFIAALVRLDRLTEAALVAIKYKEMNTLCLLVDPITIYRAALASYNINCALHVVQQTKLDPSEYVPFLQGLEQTEENYSKFKICDYLDNPAEALQHLAECTEDERFEECIAYIQKKMLYVTALKVFSAKYEKEKPMNQRLQRILTLTAEFFYERGDHVNAALLFETAGLEDQALSCYINDGDWQSAVSLYKRRNNDASKTEIYLKIYEALHRKGQYENAGFIAYNFLEDCEKAVDSYLKAKKYCSAINVAKGLRNDMIIEDTIRPRMHTDAEQMQKIMTADASDVTLYSERLKVVHKKKSNCDDDDRLSCISFDSSDSGSMSSFASGASSSSSAKRARRRERKLWNLKEGNPREEPSLLNIIREKIENGWKQYSTIVPDLLKGLVKVQDLTKAEQLEKKFEEVRQIFLDKQSEVWSAEHLIEEGGFKDVQIRCPPVVSLQKELISSLFS